MERLLAEQRKQLGGFEAIDFVDEERIARMRQHLDVSAPIRLHWTWEYGEEVEELRRLYEKGKAAQWNAETDLEWSTPVTPDEWVMSDQNSLMVQLCKLTGRDEATQKAAAFDELGYLFSQLLHGEQAALQLCGQLTNLCETMDEKAYAASQVADEARHVEALSKFLQRKLGTLYPIAPTIKFLLDELLSVPSARKKTLGMQTLFEGIAVAIFDVTRSETQNPLIADMIRRIEQDESRHAAFGVLTMRRALREAEPAEKHEMEDWAFAILEALNANQNLDMLRVLGPRYGLDPEQVVGATVALPNFAEFNSVVFMHTVVPNLRNLGLITERTEARYRELGMLFEAEDRAGGRARAER